jgi:hypothetical protein
MIGRVAEALGEHSVLHPDGAIDSDGSSRLAGCIYW